MIDKT
jgi:hypothetical protein